ncbi:lysine histidine transporter-like 8 [Arachis duranensis]|uniref:Lysine histidine transporter-like 8 n=1 Tax=Arachis duranensis TaxID=130453 RepID=A0A9C6TDR1_ARADU|nr:lysine histidine transporter-like 8 [Arachis duranensis]
MAEEEVKERNFRSGTVLLSNSDAILKPPLPPHQASTLLIHIDNINEHQNQHHRRHSSSSSQIYPTNSEFEDEPSSGLSQQQGPKDEWLPITESRNGNAYFAAFHILNSNIGFQALMLPVAFATLGWAWGSVCLSLAFIWQLYTIFLLVELHESVPGIRHSRFLVLAMAAFGKKLGKVAALFPVSYLSGGTCVILIITGGGTLDLLFKTLCEKDNCTLHSLTGVQWYLIFTCIAILIAQLPNLNSMAAVSAVGSVAAIAYCTLFWAISVKTGKPNDDVSYSTTMHGSNVAKANDVMNSIGIILLAFRGHNLILEIQGTLPSDLKEKSNVKMRRGVIISYAIIAMCVYPLALPGFWAYGKQIEKDGLLTSFVHMHAHQVTKFTIGAMYFLVILHCLSSYQVYAMPFFDNIEFKITARKNNKCPRWVRICIRLFFGGLTFFVAVVFPFLPSLSLLLGGIAFVPMSYAYPCFMWVAIKKPRTRSFAWCFNVVLGCLGMFIAALLIASALKTLIDKRLNANFFKP